MSAANYSSRSAPGAVAVDVAGASVALPLPDLVPAGALVLPPAPSDAALQAVEAVLNAAERFTSEEQAAIHFRFKFAETDLAVRLERRAGEFHATFRTDSDELRQALAHEWRAVNDAAGSIRLAPAVFTSAEGHTADPGGLGGESAPGQGGNAEGQRADHPVSAPAARRSGAAAPTAGEVPPASSLLGAHATARHLHTLA